MEELPKELGASRIAAVLTGAMTLDEARKGLEQQRAIEAQMAAPDETWPMLQVVWDMDPARWHMSMGGQDASAFGVHSPLTEVVWTNLAALYDALDPWSRRPSDPFSPDYRQKSAQLVLHLGAGGKVTPPFVVASEEGLCIVGGNHRTGWAKHMGQTDIPVIVRKPERPKIEKRILLWIP